MASYIPRGRAWEFLLESSHARDPTWFLESGAAGVVVQISWPERDEALKGCGIPVVGISNWPAGPPWPRVVSDNPAVGRMVADHFLERGFKHFGYMGYPDRWGCALRREAFTARVREAGGDCESFLRPLGGNVYEPAEYKEDFAAWVRRLPKPAAVMGCNDSRGWQVLAACRDLGLQVPREVAVVGVDNDDVVCDLARPRLSSLDLGQERIGYQAAALLEDLMDGRPAPEGPMLVAPKGIVLRESSDTWAVGDPDLAAALAFIREHAGRMLRVEDVIGRVSVSRRSLERRFRELLGRTIAEEIRRAHTDRAKRLLAETDLPLAKVAKAAGFDYPQRLSTVFKQETGVTPRQYRQRFRWR
jgi:LacI family transcriptional regulator